MSETKRTKGSTTRRAAGRGAVDVLEKAAKPPAAAETASLGVAVPVETLDGIDDILGEILPPPPPPAIEDDLDALLGEIAPTNVIEAPVEPTESVDYVLGQVVAPAPAATDSFDDLLGEIAPVAAEPVDALDHLLGEIAPLGAAEPVDALDDLLGEIAPQAAAAPFDDLDDILGEFAPPAAAAPVDDLDDILGELAPLAPAAPLDELDDLLGEIAPLAPAEPADSLEDILGELAPPAAAAPVDDLDDLLGELAPLPASAAAGESLDDLLGELAPAAKPVAAAKGGKPAEPVTPEAGEPAPLSDDFSAMLDEMTAAMPDPVAEDDAPTETGGAEEGEGGPKKPGIVTRLRALAGTVLGAATTPFKGKREISRKAFAGMIASIGALGTVVVGQTTYIIARPSGVVHHAPEPAPARTIVPVDYSKVDMTLYHDKVRMLPEGGRDMLRNPAIKQAVLNLDNGEMLHEELRELAQGNAAADRVDIRNDQVTINSCEGMICPAKSFKLVYRLQSEDAVVCISERSGEGLPLSYSYGPDGYHEWPSCDAVH